MSSSISDRVRKRLWTRAGNACAYPGCPETLLKPTPGGDDDTILGEECHIVAQRDHPSVARATCLLTEDEKREWADLIEHRHSYKNLVLMCGTHSILIDDPGQGFSVQDVVNFKKAHEAAVEERRRKERASAAPGIDQATEARFARPMVLDDLGAWQRKAVAALAEQNPRELAWLHSQIGEPPERERISNLIRAWPQPVADGSDMLVIALIRHAEAVGLWSHAADAWERGAARAETASERADRLTRAAIDASAGGDAARREQLLAKAEQADPDCPRLLLERIDAHTPPAEQLNLLDEIHTEDRPLMAVIACQKAMASLLLPDVDAAEGYLAEAMKLDPDSMAIRTASVNVRVQRARIALNEDKAFTLTEAVSAQADALALREEMIPMARWDESGRLLMLAADIYGVQRDLESAEDLLSRALPEELAVPDGPVVLGDAALRVGAAELALRFVADAPENDSIVRVRAAAEIDARPGKRVAGLKTLEKLAQKGSRESEYAAAARLLACLPPIKAPWNEEMAAVLEASEHHTHMSSKLRILALAATDDLIEAGKLASSLPDDAESAELRLRVAGLRGKHSDMRKEAERFLQFAPDAAGRLLAAEALEKAGKLDRASEITAQIAHDPNSPPRMRADAFAACLQVLAKQDRWLHADREWQDFQRLSNKTLKRPDQRVSAWQVRILHHRKHNAA